MKIPVFISLLKLKSSNGSQAWQRRHLQTQPLGSVAHQLGTLGQDSAAALYLFPCLHQEDHKVPAGEVRVEV